MKKLLILIFILISTSLFSKPLNKEHTVGVLKDWKPYYFLDKKGQPKGYAIELFEKLASNLDLKFKYIIVNDWKEMWELIEENKIDIVPNVGISSKRAEFLSFTQATDVFEIGLFKNKSLTQLNSIAQIKNYSCGIVLKNICTKLINDNSIDHKILYNSYHRALAAINNNEIDILCYPKPLVENSIKELNIKTIEPLGKPLKIIQRAVGVSKNEEHLLDILDREILRIKGNGQYQEIYNKWFTKHKDIEIDYYQMAFILLILLLIIFILLYYIRSKNLLLTKKELNEKISQIEKLKNEQLEQQKIILTQSKITSMGELITNIAHQWRQPLSVISTNVSSLELDVGLGEKISEEKIIQCSKDVITQTNYLSKTIDDFRDFFKKDSDTIKKHNLKELFIKLDNMVKKSFEENNIVCIHDFQSDIILELNDNSLIQSLLNICNNSKDIMISKIKDKEQRYFFVSTKKLKNHAQIIFRDSGGGIDTDVIDKIFEPYFTTKHQSLGTGIGLYMTYLTITKHLNGTIKVSNIDYKYNSKKLKGAEFVITLPVNN